MPVVSDLISHACAMKPSYEPKKMGAAEFPAAEHRVREKWHLERTRVPHAPSHVYCPLHLFHLESLSFTLLQSTSDLAGDMFLISVNRSSELTELKERSWGPLIYDQLVRSTRDNLGLRLAPEVDGEGQFYRSEPLTWGI